MLYYPTVPPCSPDISIIPPYLFFFRWSAIVIFSSLGVINSSMFHGIKPVVVFMSGNMTVFFSIRGQLLVLFPTFGWVVYFLTGLVLCPFSSFRKYIIHRFPLFVILPYCIPWSSWMLCLCYWGLGCDIMCFCSLTEHVSPSLSLCIFIYQSFQCSN